VLDAIGHVGYILLLIGTLLVTRRQAAGWLFRLAGESIWVVLGIKLGLTSVVTWGLVFIILELRGWWAWRK